MRKETVVAWFKILCQNLYNLTEEYHGPPGLEMKWRPLEFKVGNSVLLSVTEFRDISR